MYEPCSLVVWPELGFELCLNMKNLAHEKGTLPTQLHVKSDMCTVTVASWFGMSTTETSWADKSNINILHGFVAAVVFRAM